MACFEENTDMTFLSGKGSGSARKWLHNQPLALIVNQRPGIRVLHLPRLMSILCPLIILHLKRRYI